MPSATIHQPVVEPIIMRMVITTNDSTPTCWKLVRMAKSRPMAHTRAGRARPADRRRNGDEHEDHGKHRKQGFNQRFTSSWMTVLTHYTHQSEKVPRRVAFSRQAGQNPEGQSKVAPFEGASMYV